jgi:4-amino-4-deoxy-L-arabinose transferase-like glycosyltransferase
MKRNWLIILIIFGGFLLRFWSVGSLPAILNRDEAALAYNALLLKETGKDEWGKTWPLALASFGDYKLIGYPAILTGVFSVFGYSDMAVRLPSVLAGTTLIAATYFFLRKLYVVKEWWAIFGALLVAIQPIFFFYSRVAFEANVALLLFVMGLTLLLLGTKKKTLIKDSCALLCMLIAIFTYNTPLLLLPFLLPVIIFWKGWRQVRKWSFSVCGLVVICAIGFFSLLSLSKQKAGITIFSDETVWRQSVEYHDQFTGIQQKIFGNHIVFFGQIMVRNYVNTLLPDFVVIKGGAHPWHQLPGFGHLYWTTYLLGWTGILLCFTEIIRFLRKKKKTPKLQIILLYLFIISPLPAVVTVDAPHATRSLFFFFLFVLFAVIGASKIFVLFQKKIFLLILIAILLCAESVWYFRNYFVFYPSESAQILHGGFAQFINQLETEAGSDRVAIVDDGGFQYILTAWYLKMKPNDFASTVEKHLPDRIGFRYGYRVGRYRFVVSPNDRFANESELVSWNSEKNVWEVVHE